MISVFDLYKIGIGPSSSHTMGPMIAAGRFRDIVEKAGVDRCRVEVIVYGSLAWTGKGHGTDRAICLGLLGQEPQTVDPDDVGPLIERLAAEGKVTLGNGGEIEFHPASSVVFEKKATLLGHPNGMRFRAVSMYGTILEERVYYSPGGGFVLAQGEPDPGESVTVPYPFRNAAELLSLASTSGLSISGIQRANERVSRSDDEIDRGLDAIQDAMFACIDRGMSLEGELPGGLRVKRRAGLLREGLIGTLHSNTAPPHDKLGWVSAYALAVNEENAAGGRVVTAPTNGAAGIVPAILRYYRDFLPGSSGAGSHDFLLTSAAIGMIIKTNASISGAEVGCQGEVGSAAAMAAAGLAAVSGGTPAHIENAAEIALEHHLGMTCDPVGGLVQVPCIERNAIGAHKAIAAASLALRGDGQHRVSLDEVIETMRQTGLDMKSKYKETSRGGLAVNVAEC